MRLYLQENLVGIYTFHRDNFSVGKIENIDEKYLILKNYDVNSDTIGIKIFLLSSIKRVIEKSVYIESLKNRFKKNVI